MKIIELDKEVEIEGPTSLALGFFDGIHLGHRRILERAGNISRKKGWRSGILTFNRHPRELLLPDSHFHYLTTLAEREKIVDFIGLDYFIIMPFTREVANTGAGDFIDKILLKKLKARAVVVGYDYHFGKGAEGNVALLREKLEPLGVEVHVMGEIVLDHERVGSTQIRNDILKGAFDHANRSLGRWYSLEGRVIQGKRRGRELGIPTANLALPEEKVIPPEGVYCVLALHEGKIYRGVGNVGTRPTFGEYHPNIEIHLLDFNKHIYGDKLRIFFIRHIRDIIRFDSVSDLVERIKSDITFCREKFGEITPQEMEINFRCCPEALGGLKIDQ